jgi:hypothetical protein
LLVVALAAAPAASAKKSKPVGGTIIASVPSGPDPNTNTALVSGVIRSGKGCAAERIIRFAFFNADGTPTPVGQPTVVSAPNGSFIAALPSPDIVFAPDPPKIYLVKVAVDPAKKKKKGKKVSCNAITGPDAQFTVSPRQ